jgi:hypothetical protein
VASSKSCRSCIGNDPVIAAIAALVASVAWRSVMETPSRRVGVRWPHRPSGTQLVDYDDGTPSLSRL